MKFNKKLATTLISASLTLSGAMVTTPSFAGHRHGGHHGGGSHHRHHDHFGNGVAVGLGFGILAGAIAASASQPHYYHGGGCRRVVIRRNCYRNGWGDHVCRRVRSVRYVC